MPRTVRSRCFGAFLAIAGGTSAALTSSHSREPAPQVAPQQDEQLPNAEQRGDAEKTVNEQEAAKVRVDKALSPAPRPSDRVAP